MIADYWIVRRRELNVADLYRVSGRYGGVNPVAIIALVLGVAPSVPGFLNQVHVVEGVPAFFNAIYTYAWFIGVANAAGVYLLGTKLRRPA